MDEQTGLVAPMDPPQADLPIPRGSRGSLKTFLEEIHLARRHGHRPTILVGSGERAMIAAQEVAAARNGFAVVGLVSEPREARHPWLAGVPHLGTPADLPELIRRTGAVAVVTTHRAAEEYASVARLRSAAADVEVLDFPTLIEHLSGRIPVSHVEDGWLETRLEKEPGRTYRWTKRAGDVAASLFALTVLGVLFPLLAPAIWLSTRGTPIFRQHRVGLGGRTYCVYKLRSMVQHAEAPGEPVWAEVNDQRVTRLGRFLRKTRLDEVPQFVNVLRGNMSLVGPRPERPYFVEKLRREIRHYDWRHTVLPGITGWAQVNQGYAACVEESLRKLELDLYYIKRRSIGLECRILWRTVAVVLGSRGAR